MAASASGQTVKPPYSITISASEPTVVAGSDVYIRIKLTNISDKVVDCSDGYEGDSNVSYQYDVRDENGRSIRKPDIHPELMPGDLKMCSFGPGKTHESSVLVSWLYDFGKPGKFTVQVSRRVSNDRKDDVKSNVITIAVVEPEAPPAEAK